MKITNLDAFRKNKEKPSILLVEDHPVIQLMHGTMLRELGCHLEIASTGGEALQMFKKGYDLIFLDVGLPDMRGSEVAAHIRHFEKESKCPRKNILIGLTAFGAEVHVECISAGMDEVIHAKPIAQEHLRHILGKWLPTKFK